MTKPSLQSKFDALFGAVDEAILDAPEHELMGFLTEMGDDAGAAVQNARAQVDAVIGAYGKGLMAAARARVQRATFFRPLTGSGVMDPAAARARLAKLLQGSKLPATLAARDGKTMSDRDVLSLLADLEELGLGDEIDK